MNVALLMVTFAKDLPFAEYSARSVAKFCSGFSEFVIVVPHADVDAFAPLAAYGAKVRGFDEPAGKGMLAHMACIMEADTWCPEADAILHIDADCIFWEKCTPDDFFVDGKPVLYREKFEEFRHLHPTRYGWKEAVAKATGIDPEFECMVRHPSIHLTPTYGLARHIISRHTGMNWREYILSCENAYPQTFCEFATLGAVAIKHAHDLYHFHDWQSPQQNYVYERWRDKLVQLWSHCGIDGTCERHPGKTAREVCEEILK